MVEIIMSNQFYLVSLSVEMSEEEQGDPGENLEKELRNINAKNCAKCKKKFKPASDIQQVCLLCFQSNKKTAPRSDERKRGASSSPQSTEEAKRNKIDNQNDEESDVLLRNKANPEDCPDIGFIVNNIDSVGSVSMVDNIKALLSAYEKQKLQVQELSAANAKLEKDILNIKVTFADNALKIIRSDNTRASYASVLGGNKPEEGKAILIAKASTQVDLEKMDCLLDSRKNGPVTQNLRQKNDKVALTFSDAAARDKTQKILQTSTEGKQIFHAVSNSVHYLPALIKYVNLEAPEESILADIKYRNPILKEHAKSVKIIFGSHPNPSAMKS